MLPAWTPDLATLDLLLSVAEFGSVGRAAEAHHISQPSASGRLAHLERRLGVPVLVRSTRGSTLTPAEYLLPAWLLKLRRRNPDVQASVTVANSQDVCARLRAGQADVGLVESPVVPHDLTVARIGSDRLVLVVSPDYPLAARVSRPLAPTDLVELPLLLREPGSGTRDTFLAALAAALRLPSPPELRFASELGSTTTIVATARAGGGIGVVSEYAAAADRDAGSLVEVPVSELDLRRDLHAVWAGNPAPPLARELIRLAEAAGRPGRS